MFGVKSNSYPRLSISMKEEIIEQLDALIETGQQLIDSFQKDHRGLDHSRVPETEFRRFVTSAIATIERTTEKNTVYQRQIPLELADLGLLGYNVSLIQTIAGVLFALRDDVEQGLLISLESRLRANIHDDLLKQASELLGAGYHVAAMVLIGGVLENHLQKTAQARGLRLPRKGSISKYNDLLRNNSYNKPLWRRIQSIADLRNEAAHGKGSAIASAHVKDAHTFVQRFIADHPA